MPEIQAYEFSFSDVVNGAIGATLFALVGILLRYLTPRLWRYILAGAKARRRRNYIEIWKRIKSDEYYASCQKDEIVFAVVVLALPTLMLVMYATLEMVQQFNWQVGSFILLLALCWSVVLVVSSWEQACNRKALVYRMRAERKRKHP